MLIFNKNFFALVILHNFLHDHAYKGFYSWNRNSRGHWLIKFDHATCTCNRQKMFVFTASGYMTLHHGKDHWLSGAWFIDH